MGKILIVSIHTNHSSQSFPLAAAQLKAFAVGRDSSLSEILLQDFTVSDTPESIALELKGLDPEFVGFSCYLWNRALVEEVCQLLRDSLPQVRLIAGGAEATADPRGLFFSAGLDAVIRGEGEIPFLELLQCPVERWGYIDGVYTGGESLPPITVLEDPAESPSPFDSDLLENRDVVLWELSRGCPFACGFCFESRGSSGVRSYPMERIRRELQLFVESGIRQVFVLDPTFNFKKERAKEILRLIRKTAPGIYFYFEIRPEFLDREMAALFSEVTCSLQIGLQSADSGVLEKINRRFQPDQFHQRIGLLNQSGAVFGFDLIYGLPGDSLEGFKNSMDFALALLPNHLDIFPLAILPGTPLYDQRQEFGLSGDSKPPYLVHETPDFPKEDMNAAAELARGCWSFYNEGKAVGWFMTALSVLSVRPSDFLYRFSLWKSGREGGLTELQLAFLKQEYKREARQRFFPLIRDLILFHGALGELGDSPEICIPPENGEFSLEKSYRLDDSVRLLSLGHSLYDLWETGVDDLEQIYKQCPAENCSALLYYSNEGIMPVSLYPESFNILGALKKGKSLSDLLKKRGYSEKRNLQALRSFWEEGIIKGQ